MKLDSLVFWKKNSWTVQFSSSRYLETFNVYFIVLFSWEMYLDTSLSDVQTYTIQMRWFCKATQLVFDLVQAFLVLYTAFWTQIHQAAKLFYSLTIKFPTSTSREVIIGIRNQFYFSFFLKRVNWGKQQNWMPWIAFLIYFLYVENCSFTYYSKMCLPLLISFLTKAELFK